MNLDIDFKSVQDGCLADVRNLNHQRTMLTTTVRSRKITRV
jgi:hypothetical protein